MNYGTSHKIVFYSLINGVGNSTIAYQLARLLRLHFYQEQKDDLVYSKGSLIEIQASDGWRWKSSLSREDTGNGACELMKVESIVWQ